MSDPAPKSNLLAFPAQPAPEEPEPPTPATQAQDRRVSPTERRMVPRRVLSALHAKADFQTRRAAIFGVHLALANQTAYRKAQREIRDILRELAESQGRAA